MYKVNQMSSVIFYLKVQLAVDIVSSSTWDDEFSILILHATCWVRKSQVVFPVPENSWNKQVLWILGYGVTSCLCKFVQVMHKSNDIYFLRTKGSVCHKHQNTAWGPCHCHQKLNHNKWTCQYNHLLTNCILWTMYINYLHNIMI